MKLICLVGTDPDIADGVFNILESDLKSSDVVKTELPDGFQISAEFPSEEDISETKADLSQKYPFDIEYV